MTTKLTAQVGSYDRYSRSVVVVASTPNPTRAYDADGKPILESLVGWDTSRFIKNPIVLYMHNPYTPVGRATDLEEMPDGGLKMRIVMLHQGVSAVADEVAGCLEDDVLRAVSVGFVPGASTKNADGTWTRRNNELLELSIVSVPADEDAGTSEINPEAAEEDDEARAKRVSAAASELAKARARARAKKTKAAPRLDADDQLRFDVGGRLQKAKRTSLGGAYVPARISRTGVLRYVLPNGTVRRELRHPDEVFKADSLATLDSVPVIDIKDHTAILSPDDYRRASLGHVKSYRHDGRFVESELVVQDAATLDAIDAGERTEISCGYVCKLDMTAGVFEGEAYDCVQRDIRYNHVALCPPNRGRAGPEVGLRLDNQPDARWGVANITTGEQVMKMIRLDGKDFEVGSEAHLDKLDSMHKEALAKAVTEAASAVQVKLDAAEAAKTASDKARDEAQGRCDAATTALEQFKTDAKAKAKKEEEDMEEKKKAERSGILSKMRLIARVARFFGDDEDEEDEKKMDARFDAMLEKSDRDLMLSVITKSQPTFDAKDRSDDYVRSRFDSIVETAQDDRGINGVTRKVVELSQTLDANDDPVTAARKKRDAASANAWKGAPAKT